MERKISVLIFPTTYVSNITYSKKSLSDIIINNIIRVHVMYPMFLSDFNENYILPTDFRKIIRKIS